MRTDLDDVAGWDNEDVEYGEEFWSGLPRPILWRILVMPIRPRRISKGGIHLATSTQDAQQYLNYVGKIVAMGGCAFKSDRFSGETNFPGVGEYVIYGRYAGQPLTYRGVRLLTVNDDEILGVVADPEQLKIHV